MRKEKQVPLCFGFVQSSDAIWYLLTSKDLCFITLILIIADIFSCYDWVKCENQDDIYIFDTSVLLFLIRIQTGIQPTYFNLFCHANPSAVWHGSFIGLFNDPWKFFYGPALLKDWMNIFLPSSSIFCVSSSWRSSKANDIIDILQKWNKIYQFLQIFLNITVVE